MGPKKKKNVYNDFYFFMQDQKKVLRREGRGWDTMDDLASISASRWRQVPDSDKARLVYNDIYAIKVGQKFNFLNDIINHIRNLFNLCHFNFTGTKIWLKTIKSRNVKTYLTNSMHKGEVCLH